MGAFSAWFSNGLTRKHMSGWSATGYRLAAGLARLWSLVRPSLLKPKQTIVVADFHPSRQMLLECLGGLPACIALPFLPPDPIPNVRYVLLRTDVVPMDWGDDVSCGDVGPIDTVASFLSWGRVQGQTMRHWWRRNIRRIWFVHEDVKVGIPPFLGGACKKALRLLHSLWPGRGPNYFERQCRSFQLSRRAFSPGSESGDLRPSFGGPVSPGTNEALRIIHYIESLDSGGAERQLCNTAVAQKRDGHDVRVLLERPPVGRLGHYLPLLQEAGIPAYATGSRSREDFPDRWDKAGLSLRNMPPLPDELRKPVLDLAGEMLLHTPQLLHCWLDWPNIVGFLAAQIADVTPVLLSFHSVSPEKIPNFLRPWMRPWYQVAASTPGVWMAANSQAGAHDYERWLGLASGAVRVVRNAFVLPAHPDAATIARFRQGMGLTPATPVVAGVLRLSPEKRPLFFLNVIARLKKLVPGLRVLLAGHGILDQEVRAEVGRLGLEQTIHLLGQRQDIPVILSVSQALLLVSKIEGIPNAVLEAQHFGCVPVSTDVGGMSEAMIPGESGLLCGKDDLEGLAAAAASLFNDPARRTAMAAAGRAFVDRQFNPQFNHEQTMAIYCDALAKWPHDSRVVV